MKTNRIYTVLGVVVAVAAIGMTLGAVSFAQSVPAVHCSVASSEVGVNQTATLTATGGNGTYVWSGLNLSITNSGGSQFRVSYPNPGTYPITVTSGGQTDTCNVRVVAATTVGGLQCAPAVQNVTLGQIAAVTATGGNGTYTWSSPDLTIANPNGSGFSASYATTGFKTLTVTSGSATDTCTINVLSSGTVPVTPGLPNTGGGFGR